MPKFLIGEDMPLVDRFREFTEGDFKGNLIIIEPGKVRIRKE